MRGSVGAAGCVVSSNRLLWDVGRVLAAARRRNTPVDSHMLHLMVAAPAEDVNAVLRALHAYGVVRIVWYTSNVVTLVDSSAQPADDLDAMIVQLLRDYDAPLTEHGIAASVHIDLHRIHRHVTKLEKNGMVTLRSKRFEFVLLRSRLSVFRAVGSAMLRGLVHHGQ